MRATWLQPRRTGEEREVGEMLSMRLRARSRERGDRRPIFAIFATKKLAARTARIIRSGDLTIKPTPRLCFFPGRSHLTPGRGVKCTCGLLLNTEISSFDDALLKRVHYVIIHISQKYVMLFPHLMLSRISCEILNADFARTQIGLV